MEVPRLMCEALRQHSTSTERMGPRPRPRGLAHALALGLSPGPGPEMAENSNGLVGP